MVEVFKTNITSATIAVALATELQQLFLFTAVSFDLDDCDNILRIKGDDVHPHQIISHLQSKGHFCEVLV
jgi:hypothetical protein